MLYDHFQVTSVPCVFPQVPESHALEVAVPPDVPGDVSCPTPQSHPVTLKRLAGPAPQPSVQGHRLPASPAVALWGHWLSEPLRIQVSEAVSQPGWEDGWPGRVPAPLGLALVSTGEPAVTGKEVTFSEQKTLFEQ